MYSVSMLASMLTAVGSYLIYFAVTWRDKHRTYPWGYEVIVKLVQRLWFDMVSQMCGVSGQVVFPFADTADVSSAIPCVVTTSPHGAFGIGFFILHFHRLVSDPRFQRFRCYAGGASVLFKVPLLRELLLLLRVREASQRTLDALLASGNSVALNPGGLWEQVCVSDASSLTVKRDCHSPPCPGSPLARMAQVHTTHEEEAIHLQPRLGFIRLAMRHGVPILPSYGFGENQLYRSTWYAAATLPLRRWLAEHARVGVPAVRGRFGSIFPFPTHHTFVVGRPVPVGAPNAAPTTEQIEEVLERWKAEMLRIFDEHKHLLPAEVAERGLSISIRHSPQRSKL